MTKSVVICDLDGTIANNSHRQHWLKSKPANWKAYNATMSEDLPIKPTIDVLEALYHTDKYRFIFVSGREEIYGEVTLKWLSQHLPFIDVDKKPYPYIYMRPKGDYRGDEIVKKELLYQAMQDLDFELEDILCVFDDRKKVKKMWVELGLFVFDVNQHDEEF